jgi:hypothetical protein
MTLKEICSNLIKPYGFEKDIVDIPDYDFNREIVEPGIRSALPDGAVGLRVDDDFWTVACLPYAAKAFSAEEIVAHLWPSLVGVAEYKPDSTQNVWCNFPSSDI